MKIVKYLIAALLIISITKKVHVAPDELEYYDAKTKTAKMNNGQTYVGIVEYNQATTPPNIMNSSLQLFTQISNQNYTKPAKNFVGGLNPMTSLYGIPVTGAEFHIKSNKKTIGTYWPISKIAQLNNGQTYVGIIEEQIGNYKKHGYYEVGSISTHFDEAELSSMYNISKKDSDFKSRVKEIGIVTKHKQNLKLYGVLLNPSSNFTSHTSSLKKQIIPGMEHYKKEIRNDYYALLGQDKSPQTHTHGISNAGAMYAIPG